MVEDFVNFFLFSKSNIFSQDIVKMTLLGNNVIHAGQKIMDFFLSVPKKYEVLKNIRCLLYFDNKKPYLFQGPSEHKS